jgi:transposase InsO family protein
MEMETTTKIITAWELYQQNIPINRIANHLNKHRETIGLWIKGIKKIGLLPFLDKYINAKKQERKGRQIDPVWKIRIWETRKRERDCCGEKIQYFIQKEYGVKIAVSKIYEVLNEKWRLRRKHKKNQKRGEVPKAKASREVVQMDTVDFGNIFAFTGIDIFSREADVLMTPAITSNYGAKFLEFSMPRRFDMYANLIQTDGGSEFENEFKATVASYCKIHRIARPYKKNEQAFIESFNRTLRKECLGWRKYQVNELEYAQNQVEEFLKRYHYHRPHMGLGMRPPLS